MDFFYDQRKMRTARLPVMHGTAIPVVQTDGDDGLTYNCMHCRGSTRPFKLRGVADHIKMKYVYITVILILLTAAFFLGIRSLMF